MEVHYSSSMAGRLGVGFIGSGFMTRFHIRSWEAVRDADIRGIYSPTRANAEDAAGPGAIAARRRREGVRID